MLALATLYALHRVSVWLSWSRIHLQGGRPGFHFWRLERLPTPMFWPGEFHKLIVDGMAKSQTQRETFTFTFLGGLEGKESACNAGDPGSIPGSGSSPGERKGSLLQYSCLENRMHRETWQDTVYGVSKNLTRLSD